MRCFKLIFINPLDNYRQAIINYEAAPDMEMLSLGLALKIEKLFENIKKYLRTHQPHLFEEVTNFMKDEREQLACQTAQVHTKISSSM